MADTTPAMVAAAIADFRRARRQAALQEIISRLTGEPIDLLAFDDIRQKFRVGGGLDKGLQEIPLAAIVGSVGRYTDFTRGFLPRKDYDESRWAGVRVAAVDLAGLPSIEVYKIGDVYFVLDGNHRVSVARQLGATHIQAYVTEFKTKVPLSPTDRPDDLIIKAEYAGFLERTRIDQLRPAVDLRVTAPGRYQELEIHIEAHRFLKSQAEGHEISKEEAVIDWYDHVYCPMIQLIRDRGILRDFPGRTEADLYLWIFRHRLELEKKLGWQIAPEIAVADLVTEQHADAKPLEEKWVEALLPASLEAGPPPGQWRQEWLAARHNDHLFAHILVPISGQPDSWSAVDQALLVAGREQGRLYGLHVGLSIADAAAQVVRTEFNRRCQASGIPGELSLEVGPITRTITDRARWVDLVVLHLAHPPDTRRMLKLSSGFRMVLYHCPRPVLTVPGPTTALSRALLAYDGSPKAQEGLFVATYLATQWHLPLLVLTVINETHTAEILEDAQAHLESRGVTATFLSVQGSVTETILQTAADHQCDLIIMGGYGSTPMVEVIIGSTLDQVLRESRLPLLICR